MTDGHAGPPPEPRASTTTDAGESIDRSLLSATVLDREGYPYIVHPLTDGVPRVDPALLEAWVAWAKERALLTEATVLVTPEAMGIPLAVSLSLATGLPYVIVRKRAYDMPGEQMAYAETGYGSAALYVNDVRPGDRIVVVDDVVSTGGTLEALLATLQEMEAAVAGALVFLDKGGQADAISTRRGVPIDVMRRVSVAGGRVVPVPK